MKKANCEHTIEGKKLRAKHIKQLHGHVFKERASIAKIYKEIPSGISDFSNLCKRSEKIEKTILNAELRLKRKDCWINLTEAAVVTDVHRSTISKWAEKDLLITNSKNGRDRRFSFLSVAITRLYRYRNQLQKEESKKNAEIMAEKFWQSTNLLGKQIGQIFKDELDAYYGRKTKDTWITLTKAAQILGVDKGTVSRWVTQGRIEDNGKTGRSKKVRMFSVTYIKHWMDEKNAEQDREEIRRDRAKESFEVLTNHTKI